MICERCGRLRNRATGRCVCDDYGGVAPLPVATTHPPVNAVEFAAPDPRPVSTAAAMAALDLSDRPARPPRPPAPPVGPAEPPPPVRAAGAPVGVIDAARVGRRPVAAVVYDGMLVLAARDAPRNLPAPHLAAHDAGSRMLDANVVDDVVVREDRRAGRAAIHLRNGEVVTLTWPGRKNRGVAAENLLAHAFPGKVDQGGAEVGRRAVRVAVKVAVVGALLAVFAAGGAVVFRSDPPAAAPVAPPPTLAPAEQAARAELAAVCPPWTMFAASARAGDRPDPVGLRPIVDGLDGAFERAAAVQPDPVYTSARDEVAYLRGYARRSAADVGLESVSRVTYAMRAVSAACTRAAAAP